MRDEYRIQVLDPAGSLRREFGRESQVQPRTPEEMKRVGGAREIEHDRERGAQVEVAGTWPMILDIHVDDDGIVWVLPATGLAPQEPEIMETFDLFAPDGRFVKQVAVACSGKGMTDALFFLDQERVLLLEGARWAWVLPWSYRPPPREAGASPFRVICYRMER